VGKYGTDGVATDGNIIGRMRFVCWITGAQTHSEFLLLFHCNNGCMNWPVCDVIRTLPVIFYIIADLTNNTEGCFKILSTLASICKRH
jgi:hypothetical protein